MNAAKRKHIKQFHHFQQNREKHFAPKFYTALKNQYQQFADNYKAGMSESNALMHISSHQVHTVLKSLYLDAGVHYGSLVYSQLPKAPTRTKRRAPIGFNEEMVNLINHYFETGWLDTSESITDTTRESIKRILQQATTEGQSLDWIITQLETIGVDLSRSRSRLIARTETVTATNWGGHMAAAKTGLMMNKEWLSAMDDRVRPDHAIANGQIVAFDEYFNVGGVMMLLPGARVQQNGLPTPASEVCNCRCVTLDIPVRVNGVLQEFDYGLWPQMSTV